MKNRVLNIEERYKFPSGATVMERRTLWFDAHQFTANQLNRNVYPYECVNGWYVMDSVITCSQVAVTFGRVLPQ